MFNFFGGWSDSQPAYSEMMGKLNSKWKALNKEWLALPSSRMHLSGSLNSAGSTPIVLPRVTERLKERTEGTKVHVLEKESILISGWYVFGCTLWTDMAFAGDWQEGCAVAGEGMNDYRCIRHSVRGYKHLAPRDTRVLHLASVRAIERFLYEHDPRSSSIVTHHAPSILSLPERCRDEILNCAYVSRLDDLILRCQPRLWIHGHIHHSSDYLIGATRVLANPLGYPHEPNEDFDPEFVVKLIFNESQGKQGAGISKCAFYRLFTKPSIF